MRLISEDEIRKMIEEKPVKTFCIPKGKILSPAAKDYLNCHLIRIGTAKDRARTPPRALYYDYKTGAPYSEKPECMTHMYGNRLVEKDAPMIRYRGKLDRLQAEIIMAEAVAAQSGESRKLIGDLEEMLRASRELMRCELLKEPVNIERLLGLNHEELREHSHHTDRYYGVSVMEQPTYERGVCFAHLNLLRTSVRETEVLAAAAFREENGIGRTDIIEVLNRMSSAFHIMMCRYIAGEYR